MIKLEIISAFHGKSKKNEKPYSMFWVKLPSGLVAKIWYYGVKKYEKGDFVNVTFEPDFNCNIRTVIVD